MTGVLYIDADPDLPGTVRAVCPSCSWRVTGIDHITAEELEELAVHHFNPDSLSGYVTAMILEAVSR